MDLTGLVVPGAQRWSVDPKVRFTNSPGAGDSAGGCWCAAVYDGKVVASAGTDCYSTVSVYCVADDSGGDGTYDSVSN